MPYDNAPITDVETPQFYDVAKIVDPESQEGREFASEMQTLVRKLYGQSFDPQKHTFRFLLADEPSINGFLVKGAKPNPIIVLHKGVIDGVTHGGLTYDELAAIVAHESGHNEVARRFGTRNNSKAEELGSDLYAVKLMAEAGLNAKASETLQIKLRDGESSKTKIMDALQDVHPLSENRESAAAGARAALERSGYRTEYPDTPMPQNLLHLSSTAAFKSSSDINYQADQAHYQDMTVSEKLQFLRGVANSTKSLSTDSFIGAARNLYTDQIGKLFTNIDLSKNPESHKDYEVALNDLLKTGLWRGDDGHSVKFYTRACMNLGYQVDAHAGPPLPALGDFQDFKRSIDNYVNASTAEDAQKHAKEIFDFCDKYHEALDSYSGSDMNGLLRRINLFDIHYPTEHEAAVAVAEGKTLEIPLMKQYEWANQNKDYRILKETNQLLVGGFKYDSAHPIVKTNEQPYTLRGSKYLDNFEIQDSKIISVWPKPVEFKSKTYIPWDNKSLEVEKQRLQERSAWERQLLKEGVRWDLLTTNPKQFLRIYHSALEPLKTMQPYDHPFANAFVDQMKVQASNNSNAMTKDQQLAILDGFGEPFSGDLRFSGYDIDHPYIRRTQELRPEKLSLKMAMAIRIDPLKPLPTNFPYTLDQFSDNWNSANIVSALKLKQATELNKFLNTIPVSANQLDGVVATYKDVIQIHDDCDHNPLRAKTTEPLLAELTKKANAIAVEFHHQDLEASIKQFNYLKYSKAFEYQGNLQNRLASDLISRISQVSDLSVKSQHLGKLLDTSFIPPNPQSRKTVADLVVQDIQRKLPTPHDDGSAEFSRILDLQVKNYSYRVGSVLHSDIMKGLADAVIAQPKLAYELQAQSQKKTAYGLSDDDMFSRISEAGFQQIKDNPAKRAATLEFISSPLTPHSVDHTRAALAGYGQFFEETRPDLQRDALVKFHQDFWALPLQQRTAVLNDVIFPPGTSPETFTHITDRVLDRLLVEKQTHPFTAEDFELGQQNNQSKPIGQTAKGKKPSSAKLIVESYINTVGRNNPKEAQMLVTALLSAEHSRAPGETMRMGQTLHLVLSNMGPAGAKLLQAIHSHPSTPEDIREDLKYSKIEHDVPARWDAIKIGEDVGVLNPSKTSHVGKVVGAGSFGITMINTAPDGKEYADTLLRPRAERIASREFQFMLEASDIIAKAEPKMAPIADMIREGRYSAKIETNMDLAAKQNLVAKQVMDGVKVTVNGADGTSQTFTHRVADLAEHGPEYKRAEIAQGSHFISLPEGTTAQYRHAAACSMASMQLTLRMAGLPVDRDRHGGNIKIDGDTINHFDFGMTDLELPTEAQKRALGKVLAQASKDSLLRGDFTNNALKRIDNFESPPDVKNFLAGFKRDMLAVGGYFNPEPSLRGSAVETKTTSTHKDLKGILGHALYGEHTDPIIQDAFKSELGMLGKPIEASLKKAMNESSVKITNVMSRDTIHMPELTLAEQETVHRVDPDPIVEKTLPEAAHSGLTRTSAGMNAAGMLAGANRYANAENNAERVMGAVDIAASATTVTLEAAGKMKGAGAVGAVVSTVDGVYETWKAGKQAYDRGDSASSIAVTVADKGTEVGLSTAANIFTVGMAGGATNVLYERAKENAKETAALEAKAFEMATGKRKVDVKELASDYIEGRKKDAVATYHAVLQSTPGKLVTDLKDIGVAQYDIVKTNNEINNMFTPQVNEAQSQNVASGKPQLGGYTNLRIGSTLKGSHDLSFDPELAKLGIRNYEDPKWLRENLVKRADELQKIQDNKGMWANRPQWLNRFSSEEEIDLNQIKAAQGEIDNYDKKFAEFRQKAKEIANKQPLPDHVAEQASKVGSDLADKGCTTTKVDEIQKKHFPVEQKKTIQPERYV